MGVNQSGHFAWMRRQKSRSGGIREQAGHHAATCQYRDRIGINDDWACRETEEMQDGIRLLKTDSGADDNGIVRALQDAVEITLRADHHFCGSSTGEDRVDVFWDVQRHQPCTTTKGCSARQICRTDEAT